MKNKKMKIKYNKGGNVSAHKSIGDLDLSAGAAGNQNYNSQNVGASYSKGSFTVSHMSGVDRFKDKYNSGKVNYSNSSLGLDTNIGRFGVDKRGNASYNYTTKGGTEISARGNKSGGTLSIFKALK
tara:strand:- start:1420 stop:1797 length:378 start_codon:yes stop_codon:yes gene_type:complete